MAFKKWYIYWNHLVGRMLYAFGKYAGFVGKYTEIFKKKKDCLIAKQQIKTVPEVSLPILLLCC